MLKTAEYTKLKMFLFVAFIVFTLLLVTQVSVFLRNTFGAIKEKKGDFDCANADFEITKTGYVGNNLTFRLKNAGQNQNVSLITVVTDAGEKGDIMVEPVLKDGDIREFRVNNITILESYDVYINNCKELKDEGKI